MINRALEQYFKSPVSPKLNKNCTILDPCARDGEIANSLTRLGYHPIATDLKDGEGKDATKHEYWDDRFQEFTITQPPSDSKISIGIMKQALNRSFQGCFFYVPITWLTPDTLEKETFLATKPHTTTIFSNGYCMLWFNKTSYQYSSIINYFKL